MIKDNKQRLFEMMHKVAGLPLLIESNRASIKLFTINESTNYELDEIDFSKTFTKLFPSCIPPEKLRDYFNVILQRKGEKNYAKKKELDIQMPHIHQSAIRPADDPRIKYVRGKEKGEKVPKDVTWRNLGSLNLSGSSYENIANVMGDFDIERFIKDMTDEPIPIINMNDKMARSTTPTSVTYNTGLPAFRGLIYDKDKNEFLTVNTCPGAGTCLTPCYARHGNYIQYEAPYIRLSQILNMMLNDPKGYEEKVKREVQSILDSRRNKGLIVWLRWNDSGDFFAKDYYDIAARVTDYFNTPEMLAKGYRLKSYAYTKVASIYINQTPNFLVTFSTNANTTQSNVLKQKGVWKTAKTADFLPRRFFDDLLVKTKAGKKGYQTDANGNVIFIDKVNGLNILKERIAGLHPEFDSFKEYEMTPNSILTYDEIMSVPPKEGVFWNVVVMPTGDGDVESQRTDVRKTFLSEH